ncbi:hypothetical protein ACWCXX_06300 [Streptomyces sp. NPDC001732]
MFNRNKNKTETAPLPYPAPTPGSHVPDQAPPPVGSRIPDQRRKWLQEQEDKKQR